MAMQRVQFGAILAVAMTVIVVTVLALSAVTYQTDMIGQLDLKGIRVYWDDDCTSNVTAIDWGFVEPGETIDLPVYIKNEGAKSRILSMATSDWNPIRAFGNITLNWNRENYVLKPGEVVQVLLTLEISPSINGVSDFSFKITITGTEYA